MILASNILTLVKVDDGTGVSSMTTEFYLSTSKTTQTGGSWTTEMPEWSSGKYLWTRTKIVYSNPTSTEYTTPVCDSSWEAANEAEKVATNYMNFDSNGLVVGDMTAETLGKNVLIDLDSLDIRDGETVLASFGANDIILGLNNDSSKINLCNGAGIIKSSLAEKSEATYNDAISLESEQVNVIGNRKVLIESREDVYEFVGATDPSQTGYSNIYTSGSSKQPYARIRTAVEYSSRESSAGVMLYAKTMPSGPSDYARIALTASSTDKDNGNSVQSNSVILDVAKTIFSKPIHIQDIEYTGFNKVLWSGASFMAETDTITLSEAISAQPNGIVLIWSHYTGSTVQDNGYNTSFIPKAFLNFEHATGTRLGGLSFFMVSYNANVATSKYVYISDTSITGDSANNASSSTKSSITHSPKNFVLRYVLGV